MAQILSEPLTHRIGQTCWANTLSVCLSGGGGAAGVGGAALIAGVVCCTREEVEEEEREKEREAARRRQREEEAERKKREEEEEKARGERILGIICQGWGQTDGRTLRQSNIPMNVNKAVHAERWKDTCIHGEMIRSVLLPGNIWSN